MRRRVPLPASDYSPTAFARFDPIGGFSIDNARAMMWLSQLAYEAYQPDQPATIQAVGKLWGFTRVMPFAKRKVSFKASYDTCGLIGERDKAVILAFAGTDPGVWETVITDFTLRPGGDTHAGFQDAARAPPGGLTGGGGGVQGGGGAGHGAEPGRRQAAVHHRPQPGRGDRRDR